MKPNQYLSGYPLFILLMMFVSLLGIFKPVDAQQEERFRVMFYNVENLFDLKNDTLINDEEFLPEGEKNWNEDKFYKKLNNLYKVIMHCGEWDPPALIGLCEVENRYVLEKLVHDTPLEKFNYRIIHFDSPDWRGIDVTLLYRVDYFDPDTAYPVPVRFPFDTASRTRDVLYVKGAIGGMDTVHLFVNHWPSRYGGYQATARRRNHVAGILRQELDSLLLNESSPNILIMGDFNDGPFEESLQSILGAATDSTSLGESMLFNLTAEYEQVDTIGTLKYKENWDVFDQIIVSTPLLKDGPGLKVSAEGARIFEAEYLFMEDEKYLGDKLFRTYAGYRYLGGFSDHLPVYVDLELR